MTRREQERELALAREMAEAAIAEHVLRVFTVALRLEHPTLDDDADTGDPDTLRLAREIVALARDLRRRVARYRAAVRAAIRDDDDDPLPF